MSPRTRSIFFILLGALGIFLCVLLALMFTPLPQWLANRAVDRFLERPLDLDIHIGDVGGNLYQRFALEKVEIRTEDGRLGGRVEAISFQYDWRQLARGRWRIQEASLQTPVLYLEQGETVTSGQASEIPVAPRKSPAIPDFQVDRLIITDGRLLDSGDTLVDSLGLSLSVGAGGNQVRGKISRCHFRLPQRGLRLRSLSGELSFASDRLEFLQLQVHTRGSRLELAGWMNFRPVFSCSMDVQADSLSLNELGAAFRTKQPLNGNLALKGQIEGDVHGWGGSVQLSGRAQGYRIDRLMATVSWQAGRLELADFLLKGSGVTVGGRGHLDTTGEPPDFRADLALREVDLSGLLKGAPPSRLSGRLRASGTGVRPETLLATIDLDLGAGTLADHSFEGIRGHMEYDRGQWMFHRGLELELTGAHLLLWGSLDANRRLDTWAEVEMSEIGPLLNRPELRGSLRARCRARGPLEDPEVAGQIELLNLAYGSGHMKRTSGLCRLQGAVSRKEGSFSLRFSDGGVGKLALERGYARGKFAPQKVFLDSLFVESPDGQLMVDAELGLSQDGWNIQVDSLSGTYRGYAVTNSGQLRLSRDSLGIHLEESRLLLEAGSIELQGILGPDSQIQGMGRLSEVQLEPLSHLWPQAPRLSGPIFLDMAVEGTTRAPVIQASFRWREGSFNLMTFDQVQGRLAYQKNRMTLEGFQIRRGDNLLRGEGHLPMDLSRGKLLAEEEWDLAFSGEGSSLDLLSILVSDVERIDGPFDLQVRATGTPGQPRYGGSFNLRDGSLKLASLGNSFQKLTVQAHLDGQYVVIDRLHGETPFVERNFFKRIWAKLFPSRRGGRFEAFGRINLADPAFDLNIEGHKMYVNYQEEQVEAELDARLRVTGRKEPLISGQVNLRRCLISRPVSSPPRVAAEKKPPPYALDLNIHIPKNCWLRNEAANIELRGLLRVLQQEGQLSLLGDLETIRGTYFFYGNNFRIQRGLVSFDELTDINPQLNVEAWTEVERERINLTIGGRLRSPTLTLTSSSGYGESDIIALLTLHHSSAGLDTVGAKEVVRSQALGLFGSFLQEELNRKAGSTLGVDKFRIKPGSVQGLGLRGAEVTLGTYLSSKIYVEYSRRLSQESGEQVGVEYSLSRNLSLLGNRDKNGLYRLGLSLKWDY